MAAIISTPSSRPWVASAWLAEAQSHLGPSDRAAKETAPDRTRFAAGEGAGSRARGGGRRVVLIGEALGSPPVRYVDFGHS